MTLEEIRDRIADRVVEEGECLIWTGATVQGGRPYVTVDYKRVGVRTLMAQAKGIWREGHVNPSKCGNPLCVHEDHVASMPKAKHMQKLGRIGGRDPRRMATIQTGVHPGRKLSDSQVMEIRTSTDSISEAAKRHGVSGALISRVRLHKTRKHLNPFAGLFK